MLVAQVQEHLEAIYGIKCEHRANDFVVDDKVASSLGRNVQANEELLIKEENGELFLSLYLDPALLERLRTAAPEALLDSELRGYCEVAEGVSHFLYLAHVADQDRQVSLLELETQAEVDKFATCVLYRWGEGAPAYAKHLMHRLFDDVRFRETLSSDERWRYEQANRVARAFCKRLLTSITARRLDKLLSELRYAYRLGAEAKLRHLSAVN
ncbi:MAG: hypothetical protein ACT4TC_07495 [Myxococcaceae bacterium]